MIKMAAAQANFECQQFSREILAAIEGACQELIDGKFHDQFQIDMFQGGAGTSTNMNANEVIGKRALELMGKSKGEYKYCSPHNHVNCSQSTNDAYPSALHIALALGNRKLIAELRLLVRSFRMKGREFWHIVKMGRTQLQDAVPMTLGQEFEVFARSLEDEIDALTRVETALHEVNMGGTAIGTGLNAPAGFSETCVARLAAITDMPIRLAPNLVEATQDTQAFVLYSSVLKSLSIKASKICNDLRLLSSGPSAGFQEINLPSMQPGSSIMPGKVNPVIPEVVNQVCFCVIGSDLTVTMAAEAGQLQLNVMEPVIADCLLEGQTLLRNAVTTLRENCIDGITANVDVLRALLERSIGTVTALNPVIGYDKSSALAAEALRTGKGIVELIREKKILPEEEIKRILDPASMTGARQPS
jgi:aspartate ammonia-lyase